MKGMWIIFRRELKARVATKSFIIGTLMFPIIMAAIVTISAVAGKNSPQRSFVLINEATNVIADRFVETLTHPGQKENEKVDANETNYRIERLHGTLADNATELNRRVLKKEIDGYVALPADILTSNEVIYRARSISSMVVNRDLRHAASLAVQAERLSAAGIEPERLPSIIKDVEVNSGQVTKDSAEKGSAASSFALAYAAAFLVYFTIITQGIGLLRSVLEEKTNRISEVMVSSVRPGFLMAGKILGAGSAAILQVLSWIAMLVIGTIALSQGFFPPEVINALNVPLFDVLAFFLFFVFGFFLYAAMYAAMGSMVSSEQEAQSIQSLGILPLVVPMVFMVAMINDPLGRVATWLGMIPFTSPIAMPLRMASETLPASQIALSLGLLIAGLVAVTWVAGRIYRIGILSTGKKPNMAELLKWIRTT
jgi:ABC-2 type transport system permease protein